MKKLILVAALLASATSFAAQNTFTFQVNSSGANMYVCGFHLDNEAAFNAGDGQASAAYAIWKEQLMDEWTGLPFNNSEVQTFNSLDDTNIGEAVNFTVDHSKQKVGKTGQFHEIKELTIFLSDEKFGANYYVDICYNVPLFLDLDTVDFQIQNQVQYSNIFDKDYVKKANVKGQVKTFLINATKGKKFAKNGQWRPFELSNNNSNVVDFNFEANVRHPSHEFVIVNRYHFSEVSRDNRPHVEHGAKFILNTEVVPVAKAVLNN